MSDSSPLLARVHGLLRGRADAATDPRVTVAPRVVMVECTHPDHGRLAGVAHRPDGTVPEWPATVADLASLAVDATAELERAVGVATLNALSAPDVPWRPGDPMAALSPDVSVVATVGLFRPAFVKFDDVTVRVVEREPLDCVASPPGVEVRTFTPDECDAAFDGADVCFVTGSTLVYGGIDAYLTAADSAAVPLVVLIGSTASFLPTPAFDAGVDVLAGASVADPDGVRTRALCGDCDTDLHDYGLQKGYVSARETLPGLTFEPNTDSHTP